MRRLGLARTSWLTDLCSDLLTSTQVEDGAALAEFDGIADEADGIIFSRGNIGLDVAPEKMARVQKCASRAGSLHLAK